MQQSTSNPRERSVTGAPFAAPGTRTDRSGDEVRSRSADPGQSSYGGFKNENPSYQRQGDAGRESGQRAGSRISYSDDRILDRVCERLWRAGLDVSEVSVRVEGGHVTLEGQVGSRTARRQIEECVDACQGVSDIENRIRVAPDRSESQA
ncbi:BON domain-containing protein [Cupriavidus gilardii]|uniref:BON domain-containing protein n=1 Tax=Cupriavidus gilardii TaxID=82541 RepID=UPI001FC9B637|nr:BON domain-containing protein [Cupriavidus gilardii]